MTPSKKCLSFILLWILNQTAIGASPAQLPVEAQTLLYSAVTWWGYNGAEQPHNYEYC